MGVSKVLERWGSWKASEDLSKKQFFLVAVSNAEELSLATSGSEFVVPLEDSPKSGQYGTCVVAGVAKVKLNSEVKCGQKVAANNAGEGQVAVTGQQIVGTALKTGKGGSLIPVLVHPGSGAKA